MGWLTDELMCEKTPFTNADRIRAMTDEELADLLRRIVQSMTLEFAFIVTKDEKIPVPNWLDWLQQEAQP